MELFKVNHSFFNLIPFNLKETFITIITTRVYADELTSSLKGPETKYYLLISIITLNHLHGCTSSSEVYMRALWCAATVFMSSETCLIEWIAKLRRYYRESYAIWKRKVFCHTWCIMILQLLYSVVVELFKFHILCEKRLLICKPAMWLLMPFRRSS